MRHAHSTTFNSPDQDTHSYYLACSSCAYCIISVLTAHVVKKATSTTDYTQQQPHVYPNARVAFWVCVMGGERKLLDTPAPRFCIKTATNPIQSRLASTPQLPAILSSMTSHSPRSHRLTGR